MNRAARRLRLFEADDDYQEFLACVLLGLDEGPYASLGLLHHAQSFPSDRVADEDRGNSAVS